MYEYRFFAPLLNFRATSRCCLSETLEIVKIPDAERTTLESAKKTTPSVKYEEYALGYRLRTDVPEGEPGSYLEEGRHNIDRAVTMLRLLKPQVTGYNVILNPLGPQAFHLATWPHYELWVSPETTYGRDPYSLSDGDCGRLKELIEAGAEGSVRTLELALWYFNKSYVEPHTPRDSLLDLVIALENLYLKGQKQELGFQLRTRASLVLTTLQELEERRRIYDDLKKAYGWRSDIVHGSKDPDLSFEFMLRVRDYVRRSLLVFLRTPELRENLEDVVIRGQWLPSGP